MAMGGESRRCHPSAEEKVKEKKRIIRRISTFWTRYETGDTVPAKYHHSHRINLVMTFLFNYVRMIGKKQICFVFIFKINSASPSSVLCLQLNSSGTLGRIAQGK